MALRVRFGAVMVLSCGRKRWQRGATQAFLRLQAAVRPPSDDMLPVVEDEFSQPSAQPNR